MTRKQNPGQAQAQQRTDNHQRSFQLTPIAAIVASITLLGTGGVQAQDAAAAAAAPEAAASAAEQDAPQALGAVTVRSRSRIEKLQDVPLSISVVQGAELSRLSATGIEEITKRAGNVSWNQGNQRTSSISIRGIGKVGQTEAQDPSVGLIVDGVSFAYNALSSSFDFIDIDTVEVSRGPQGTLLGKNTSVGNIIINTKRPSFTPTADYGISFRERDGLLGWAAVGGAIHEDVLAWRGTFSVNRGEGDIRNQYNNDVTYTNKDRVSGRVQFLLRPSSDFSALTRFELQPRAAETTNGRSFNVPNTHTYVNGTTVPVAENANRLSRRWFTQLGSYTLADYYSPTLTNDAARGLVTGSRGASTELNWKLAGDHTLTSITAYRDYHFNAVNDEGTLFDVSRNSGGYWNDYKQVSQELRLSSPLGGFVDYQTGLYFIRVKNSATYNRIWGNDAGAWFANDAQYKTLDADGAGRDLLRNSLANLKAATNSTPGVQEIDNKSGALFGQANWHLSEALTFTTGVRATREIRRNLGSTVIIDNGNAPELNPVAVNGVSLGGFNSNASTGELVAGGNSAAQIALADATAKKYFGAANYAALNADQRKQIAAAKALRQSQMGSLFNPAYAQPYIAWQPSITLSPSYKINPDLTVYFSFQHGEKAGIAQFYNGQSYPVKAEKTNNFELGFKSALLDKTLVLNADVFLSKIKDYQQSVQVIDVYKQNTGSSSPYSGITGNVPKVKVSGLEVDGFYAGLRNVTLRFSGAYNRAVYDSFSQAALPAEELSPGAPAYKDVSGRALPGAPKFTFNIGADYRKPVFGDKEFHVAGNLAYTSSYLSDNALSIYSRIPANFLVDAAVGLGKADKTFDVSLLVKNVFNNTTPLSQSWTSYTPGTPRSFGIQITGKI